MKTLAALALAILTASCGSHPLGLEIGDRVRAITLKSGQRVDFGSYGYSDGMAVIEIDGTLVSFNRDGRGDTVEKRVDFAEVAMWEAAK